MKTLRLIGMALFAVLMCVNFASCSSSDENEVPQIGEEIKVSLGFGGEISVSESPLSRAEVVENPDLYAIQIYSCPVADTKYEPYMHGIFDNVSSLTVSLITGYKYKFEVLFVKNAKNILKKNTTGIYSGPFNGQVDNTFTASKNGLTLGRTMTFKDGKSYVNGNVEKYYGMTTDFTPSAENKNVTIKMKKMFFGATFIADQLTEGSTLSISFESAPQVDIVYPETTVIRNFAMNNDMPKAYTSEDYTENLKITIVWKKADGAEISFGHHTIGFKRNKMHTITIKVADITSSSGLNLEFVEEGEMGTGENTTIENGEIVDTNINAGTE